LNDYLKRVVNSQYNSTIQPNQGLNFAPSLREGATTESRVIDHQHVAHGPRTNHLTLANSRYAPVVRNTSNRNLPHATVSQSKTLGLKSSVHNATNAPEVKSNTIGPQGEKMASSQFIDAMGTIIPPNSQANQIRQTAGNQT
jgi:hypothetical protein